MPNSVDDYLDRACARLRVNPAEADSIRDELHSHLEELVEAYSAGGIDRREATDLALSWFGNPRRLRDCLDIVHQGDAWWVRRLTGLGLGIVVGGILGLLLPIGGHLEFIARLFAIPSGFDVSRIHVLVNAMLAGGAIGLLSAGGRSLLAGWSIGSLVWLAEYVFYWIAMTVGASASPDAGLSIFNSVLLAPLLGGMFGAAVGAATAATMSITSRARPQIR